MIYFWVILAVIAVLAIITASGCSGCCSPTVLCNNYNIPTALVATINGVVADCAYTALPQTFVINWDAVNNQWCGTNGDTIWLAAMLCSGNQVSLIVQADAGGNVCPFSPGPCIDQLVTPTSWNPFSVTYTQLNSLCCPFDIGDTVTITVTAP